MLIGIVLLCRFKALAYMISGRLIDEALLSRLSL